jgi:hypothetical protein
LDKIRRFAARIEHAKEILKSWYYERKISPYLSESSFEHEYPQTSQEVQKTVSDSKALAYLRFALESNCCLLICGEDSGANKSLLSMLVNFIPNNESAIIIEKEAQSIVSDSLPFNIRNTYGNKYRVSSAESVDNALRLGISWIIMDEICSVEADSLFNSTNFGASFISTINTNALGSNLVTKLASRPICVMAERLSNLDASVYIDIRRNTLSIHEYSWLSRGEIEDGLSINGKDLLQSKEIVLDSKESLLGSKILRMYSHVTGLTVEQLIQKVEAKNEG